MTVTEYNNRKKNEHYCNEKITTEYIKNNNIKPGDIIVIPNTRGQSVREISKIRNDITIRIIGGMDEKKYPKFDRMKYYQRTLYTPAEVTQIIRILEEYEKQIVPEWTDLEKATYVYRNIAERMHYIRNKESKTIDGRHIQNNLLGLIYGKAVCTGFSMIFKEEMDRLGIECRYRNKSGDHSWNEIKIDGEFYPIDITWECVDSQKNGACRFSFFMNNANFYRNIHHKADGDMDPCVSRVYPTRKINDAIRKIDCNRRVKRDYTTYINANGMHYWVTKTNGGGNFDAYSIIDSHNRVSFLYLESGKDISKYLSEKNIQKAKENGGYLGRRFNIARQMSNMKVVQERTFTRRDGTSFTLCKLDRWKEKGVNRYLLMQAKNSGDKKMLYTTCIYTENNLINCSKESEEAVANSLLSSSRLKERIDSVGGYVGYLKRNENGDFERFSSDKKELEIGMYVR